MIDVVVITKSIVTPLYVLHSGLASNVVGYVLRILEAKAWILSVERSDFMKLFVFA